MVQVIYAEGVSVKGVKSVSQLQAKELEERRPEDGEEARLAGVSRFHAMIQRIVASWLRRLGFEVSLEHNVDGIHYADVFASDGVRNIIVEVETGYVPPMFISEAEVYMLARAIVKTVKYGCLADEFFIATPSYVRPPLPSLLVRSPEDAAVMTASKLVERFFGERWAEETLKNVRECRFTGLMLVNVSRRDVSVIRNEDLTSYLAEIDEVKT